MHILIETIYLCVLATLFACVEIEIEGKHGWAESLPTWKRVNAPHTYFTGGRPLTGYHLFMFAIPFVVIHSPYVLGDATWSLAKEQETLARYLIFAIVWDYLWFVLNVNFEGKFDRAHVWWHARDPWVGDKFPGSYLLFLIVSWLSVMFVSDYTIRQTMMMNHLWRLLICAGWILIAYWQRKRYHTWYIKMRIPKDAG